MQYCARACSYSTGQSACQSQALKVCDLEFERLCRAGSVGALTHKVKMLACQTLDDQESKFMLNFMMSS